MGEGALYGSKIVEEESEVQKYLVELREFRKAHPKEYKKIQTLPFRARVGRNKTNVVQDEYPIPGSTIAYLKSKNHPGVFYYVSREDVLDELSFIEAVRIFRCTEDEKAMPLHSKHHTHVQQSLEYFTEDVQVQAVESITRKSLNPAENKAISNIQMVIGSAHTAQKKAVLAACIELIKAGGIRGLAKDVNDFFKSNQTLLRDLPVFLDKLFREVLDRYKIRTDSQNESPKRIVQRPYIVLSESFSE